MLVYFRKQGEDSLFMAQVNPEENGGERILFKKNLWGIPKAHREMILKMENDEIAVVDNLDACGDGLYKDNYLFDITGIESEYPKIFILEEGKAAPSDEELEKKYSALMKKLLSSFIIEKRAERKRDPEKTPAITKEEVDKFEAERKASLQKVMQEEMEVMKVYRETGKIGTPVRMYHYTGESKEPQGILHHEKVQVNDAATILGIVKAYGGDANDIKKAENELLKAKEALRVGALSRVSEEKSKSPESTITIESLLGEGMDTNQEVVHSYEPAVSAKTF